MKMSRCYCCLLIAALVSATALSAQQDDICPIVGRTDLTNLVTVALNSTSQGAATTYQILRYQVVCLAQGAGKDQYRMTSVVVVYQEVGGTTQFIGQFQFVCENAEWSANLGGLGNVVSTGQPTGNLSTPVRKDCRFCFDSSNSTSDEHCFGKVEREIVGNGIEERGGWKGVGCNESCNPKLIFFTIYDNVCSSK